MILERGWSTSHWTHPLDASGTATAEVPQAFREALAEADLDVLVARSRSRADVIRALGFSPSSTTYRLLRDALRARTISVAHLDAPHQAMRRSRRSRYRTPLEEILVAGSSYTSIDTLKRRLVDAALLEAVCAVCGIDTWCGMPITLHLDHVNGVRNDHRLENLRFLCPNCHSQTATFSGRNKGRYGAGPPC